jgi:Domain of unknown function (DUF5703)
MPKDRSHHRCLKKLRLALALPWFWAALLTAAAPAQAGHWTEPYDVVWTKPSKDAAGSMPLGNGEVGINLWVEDGGDLQFYISRSDAYTEISRLVKVGKVRVSLSPNPFTAGAPFRQELKLREGACEIIAGPPAQQVKLKVFVDSDSPIVAVTGESAQPLSVKATVESWRTERRVIKGDEQGSAWTMHGAPFELAEAADVFPADIRDAVAWYHRNEESTAFNSTIQVQSLQSVADKAHDPLLHRTFGGWLAGDGFSSAEGHAIATTKPVRSFALRVAAPCAQMPTAEAWLDEARKLGARKISADRTARWWREFWERSWVMTDAGVTKGLSVGQAFTLQRYMQACGGRGTFPIKFNGGIFTVEPKASGRPFNADWRAWGDAHWYQNIRHMYHPMLAEGDFEMMSPFFRLYENARPLCEARAQLYHHVEGCYFPETMTVWGTYANGDYGWNREGRQPQDVDCKYWRFAWNQGPELVALMLDYWDYTRDRKFLEDQLLPMATSVLKYFDTRFKRDAAGRILLDPTQSIETYWYGVTNDMPSAAGLTDTTARLCALPEKLVPETDRAFFEKMKAACPELPIKDGKLEPAREYQTKTSNCEDPELYAIWPFRLFGLDKSGLEVARATFIARHNHLDAGWGYDGNCAALLGLTDEAARILKVKCANSNAAYRWPATWGPNFDWLPDQNHGGNLLETAELMLLQSSGDKILLLPAWPKDWDVSFKLHAPGNTTVECVYRAGKVEKLKVTPSSRAADVVSQLRAGL